MKNLPIVYRIYGASALFLLYLIIVGVIAIVQTDKISSSLNSVTQDANRLSSLANESRISLLTLNKALVDVAVARTGEDLETARARVTKVNEQRSRFADELAQHVANFNHNAIASALSDANKGTDTLVTYAEQIADLRGKVLVESKKIASERTAFLLTADFAKQAINEKAKSAARLDSYIHDLLMKFANAIRQVDFAISNILTISVPTEMEKMLEKARLSLTQVEKYYASLKREVPELKQNSDAEKGMKSLLTAVNSEKGLIQRHIQNTDNQRRVEQRLLDASQLVASVMEQFEKTVTYVDSVIEKNEGQASEAVSSTIVWIGGAVVIGVLISAAIAWLLGRAIRAPLKQVMRVLDKMSAGDFRELVPRTSKDEFGQVAQWVNKLAENMNDELAQLRSASARINEVTEANSQTTDRARSALERLNTEIHGVAAATTQMESTLTEIATSTDSSREQTHAVEKEAGNGQGVMKESISIIESLSAKVETSNQVIGEVDNLSREINRIVDVINNVAGKTNLLALNAAIEAARAGEQGRGFAVVADEVRELASLTASSTSDIQNMISQLQQRSQTAVSSMATSVEEMSHSRSHIENASEAMDMIRERMGSVRSMSDHISEATRQQKIASEEIARNINVVSDVSNENFTEIERIAQTTTELNEMALSLEILLGRFQV